MATSEALILAREKKMDLVEISEKTNPPIAKIMDFGHFLYEQKKRKQKSKAKVKKSETKGIRLGARISEHDEETRMKQATKFLEQRNRIKIEMKLMGRERRHMDKAKEKMLAFVEKLGDETVIDQELSAQGGRLSMIVRRK